MEDLILGVEPFHVLAYFMGATVAAAGVTWKVIRLIQKIDLRGVNQNKALVEMADHSDNETERLHPDRSNNKIKPTIERILAE